jgi:hypothetical protein
MLAPRKSRAARKSRLFGQAKKSVNRVATKTQKGEALKRHARYLHVLFDEEAIPRLTDLLRGYYGRQCRLPLLSHEGT